MVSVGSVFKAARGKMVELDSDATSKEFNSQFRLSEGDYLEVLRKGQWKPCRILMVQQVYPNQRGGYTSRLTVGMLLTDGKVGTGRSLTITIRNGKLGVISGQYDNIRRTK